MYSSSTFRQASPSLPETPLKPLSIEGFPHQRFPQPASVKRPSYDSQNHTQEEVSGVLAISGPDYPDLLSVSISLTLCLGETTLT